MNVLVLVMMTIMMMLLMIRDSIVPCIDDLANEDCVIMTDLVTLR